MEASVVGRQQAPALDSRTGGSAGGIAIDKVFFGGVFSGRQAYYGIANYAYYGIAYYAIIRYNLARHNTLFRNTL